ncbi:hypothetical protein ACTFIZ_002971 [Dictyostelium cf. discoideum]
MNNINLKSSDSALLEAGVLLLEASLLLTVQSPTHDIIPLLVTIVTFIIFMNHLAKLFSLDDIALDISVTSKKRAFEQAGILFENNHGIARAVVTDNLFARESIGSTGLGAGLAIPHGRIKGLKHPLAAFIRLTEPIPFESPDGIAVSLLFFLLVPEQATQQHLEILSEIAQLLSERDIMQQLLSEQRPEAVLKLLTEWHIFELKFTWADGIEGADRTFDEEFVIEATSAADLVGYLNFIHPNRIQILGSPEFRYYQHLPEENRKRQMGEMISLLPPCLVVCDGASPPADLDTPQNEAQINRAANAP